MRNAPSFGSSRYHSIQLKFTVMGPGAHSHRIYDFRRGKRYAQRNMHLQYEAGVRCTQMTSIPSAMGVSRRKINESLIPLPTGKPLWREDFFPYIPWVKTTGCLDGISGKILNPDQENLRLSQTYLSLTISHMISRKSFAAVATPVKTSNEAYSK